MSAHDENPPENGNGQGPAPIIFSPATRRHRIPRPHRRHRRSRPRVRKLRLLFVLGGFVTLAAISLAFGVLTSIASDLPKLDATVHYRDNVDSYLYDDQGKPIGVLAPPTQTAIDSWTDISTNMVNAIISVEDKRFWGSSGIDVKGLLRAGISDLQGKATEGASTIPEEFIKIVRQEENHRTVFEKLIEAGMAFQLTHRWNHQEILTDYLNSIYFGNGALGIESAARVYFGWNHGYSASNPAGESDGGCGDPDTEDPHRKECADVLEPWEAALLAGMVANPTEFNPAGTPYEQQMARERRNLVLQDMYNQRYISRAQYDTGINEPLPTAAQIQQPQEPIDAPYFTSWVRPQIINALEKEGVPAKEATYEAYYGGLKINLTIDLSMQKAAQDTIDAEFPPGSDGPTASLVAIDNKTGEVRAMVSGDGDFENSPFNLATLGYRQPGSAFKLFTLAAAIDTGKATPYDEFNSKQVTIPFVKQDGNAYYAANGTGHFSVHNFGNEYDGMIPLTTATAISDNAVFSQLGLDIGTKYVQEYAEKMGIRSPISINPSMIIGGLTHGVSALDMAHAYETVATGGEKIWDPVLGDSNQGPVGIHSITGCDLCNSEDLDNTGKNALMQATPEISSSTASTITSLLHGPVYDSYGTGTAAAVPGVQIAGKTGTTSNYVDAWFVGFTQNLTIAVWVGYPNSGKAMTSNYGGQPVEGGTFPAVIFRNFVESADQVMQDESEHKATKSTTGTQTTEVAPTYSTPSTSSGTSTTATTEAQTTTTAATGATTVGGATNATTAPATQAPATEQAPATQTAAAPTPATPAPSTPTPTAPSSQTVTPPPPSSSSSTSASGGSGL